MLLIVNDLGVQLPWCDIICGGVWSKMWNRTKVNCGCKL